MPRQRTTTEGVPFPRTLVTGKTTRRVKREPTRYNSRACKGEHGMPGHQWWLHEKERPNEELNCKSVDPRDPPGRAPTAFDLERAAADPIVEQEHRRPGEEPDEALGKTGVLARERRRAGVCVKCGEPATQSRCEDCKAREKETRDQRKASKLNANFNVELPPPSDADANALADGVT